MVKDTHSLEGLISHILTLGTLFSITLLTIGLALYVIQIKTLTLTLDDSWIMGGESIFNVIGTLLKDLWSNRAYTFIASGILLLMLTQYLRVIASAVYFTTIRDWKYVGITLTVLIILTLSLLGYFSL